MDPRNNVTTEEAENIEQFTREQSGSYKWKEERHWRLTASRFGEICRATERRDMSSLAKSILNPPDLSRLPAVSYGKAQEANAIKKFMEVTKLEVTKCGLFVDIDHGFLAATPDGIIDEDTLLEVKSPYTGRKEHISPGKWFSHLEQRDGELKLKKLHPYMYQVQGQMAICKRKQCYFVTYTLVDLHYELIKFDAEFYQQEMFPLLQQFFTEHYKPAIVKELVKDSSDMEYSDMGDCDAAGDEDRPAPEEE